MNEGFSLDVASPGEVAMILRNAAAVYQESASELTASWQDEGAGRVWEHLAKVLESAAEKAEKVVETHWGH